MKKIFLSISILLGTPFVADNWATAQIQRDPMVTATLNIYNDELRNDPSNYQVLFRRAFLYYGQNQYNQALTDISKAISLIPKSDSDLLSQSYNLRANIYLMSDQNQLALEDLKQSLSLDPSNYATLYQVANTEYLLGNYVEAKNCYKKLQRLQNRSLESLIGLARVAIKENNLGLANEYADEAVALYPSNSEAYIRRASVRRQLGNMTGAVDDLILAIAVDKNSSNAIAEIVNISNEDYNAVISALSSAISQAPQNGVYLYIRANIQQAHYHYLPAIADYKDILNRNLYTYHGIHASLAECYYALTRYKEALDEINYAIGQTENNASYIVVRSKIRLAMGNDIAAMESAILALDKNPELNSALVQKGLAAISQRRYNDASDYIGEAVVNAPDDSKLLILRGWILDNEMHRKAEAMSFYQRAIEASISPSSIASLKGFALLLEGNADEARKWLEDALYLSPIDVDGRLHYLAACLYAQLGDEDKALVMMETALQRGYANLYDWKDNDFANINISPLRGTGRFEDLLSKYAFLF